jgi:hypothetical protein
MPMLYKFHGPNQGNPPDSTGRARRNWPERDVEYARRGAGMAIGAMSAKYAASKLTRSINSHSMWDDILDLITGGVF